MLSIPRFLRLPGLACMLLAVAACTGCMTTPYHYEVVGPVNKPVYTAGYVAAPNQTIYIQVRKNSASNWVTVGVTKSSSYAIHWDGVDWYSWNDKVSIPLSQWQPFFQGYFTEMRAVMNGSPLYTFDADFNECWEYDKTLSELWQECGHDDSVLIFATQAS